MAATHTFEESSALAAGAADVWSFVATMRGVNHELWPIVQMTAPREAEGLDLGAAPVGERLFRSWVLLFGVLPIDYDDITLARVEPGRGFLETSVMATQRAWRHERTIEPTARGCRITDRLALSPRVPALGPLFAAAFHLAFANRHRRLRARFGAA